MSSPLTVKICTGRSCGERFSPFIEKRLLSDKDFYGYPEDVIIETCLCQGRCKEGPTVVFDTDVQTYMNPIKASETLRRKSENGKIKGKNMHPNKELIDIAKANSSILTPNRGYHYRLLNETELQVLIVLQEKFINIKNHNA